MKDLGFMEWKMMIKINAPYILYLFYITKNDLGFMKWKNDKNKC